MLVLVLYAPDRGLNLAAFTKAGVPYSPIINLRHVFCTRLSWVAPDTVIQRAMRHTSPETKQRYQLGMVEQVRKNMERVNRRVYRASKALHFYDTAPVVEKLKTNKSCK